MDWGKITVKLFGDRILRVIFNFKGTNLKLVIQRICLILVFELPLLHSHNSCLRNPQFEPKLNLKENGAFSFINLKR